MDQIEDGGQAFPLPEARDHLGIGLYEAQRGMSLRDWFAGQAISGLVEEWPSNGAAFEAAGIAYAIADAMLAVRKGG